MLKTSEESLSWGYLVISRHVLSYIIMKDNICLDNEYTGHPSGMWFWDSPKLTQLQ